MNTKMKLILCGWGLVSALAACNVPKAINATSNLAVPAQYAGFNNDSTNAGQISWADYFDDEMLQNLIDTALVNNKELLKTWQEILKSRADIQERKAALLPNGGLKWGMGVDKAARYTSQGAGDAATEMTPGKKVPEWIPDFNVGFFARWEADIWKKLRNEKAAAMQHYFATEAGRHFVITNLIAEIAEQYYELQALDNLKEILSQNIKIQKDALAVVKVQKEATRATSLGVQKFQAEVYKTESMAFDIQQSITVAENKINMLLGRFPQHIPRKSVDYQNAARFRVNWGTPAAILLQRPDVIAAEQELKGTHFELKVARAAFLPSLGFSTFVGLQAFKPQYLTHLPESIVGSLLGDMIAPLINRNAIKAQFNRANARQLQALYEYDQSILNAYMEIANEQAHVENSNAAYMKKQAQVQTLNQAIDVATDLFKYAKADYLEVLMTQRDVLEAKVELVESQKEKMITKVRAYKSLGGGWK